MNKKTTHLVTFEALRNSRMSNAQQSPPQVSDAATFIESHCKTVSVASPPDDDQTCPLYTVRHKDMDEEDTDKTGSESPVRIDLAACHHIFGIRCLRELTSLGEPLSSRCPLCRAYWFTSVYDDEDSELAQWLVQIQALQRHDMIEQEQNQYNDETALDSWAQTEGGNWFPLSDTPSPPAAMTYDEFSQALEAMFSTTGPRRIHHEAATRYLTYWHPEEDRRATADWRVDEHGLDWREEERGLVGRPLGHGQPRIGRRRAFLKFLRRRLARDRTEPSRALHSIWW
jgi:hypothetical protein